MLTITIIPLLSDNYAYLIKDEATSQIAIVDPSQAVPVMAALKDEPLHWIMVTHRHHDHIGGVAALVDHHDALIVAPLKEQDAIAQSSKVAVTEAVSHGDTWSLGESTAQVLEVPGHTMGHIAYYFADSQALFCGDSLFSLGCGRLFEGDGEDLWRTMKTIRALPDETLIYCGHEYTLANGAFALDVDENNENLQQRIAQAKSQRARNEPTLPVSLGDEKLCNPFLRGDDLSFVQSLGMEGMSPAAVVAELRRRKDYF